MSSDRINKLLASSLVSKMVENGGKAGQEDISFQDLEKLYEKALNEVEKSPEIRKELVRSLKSYQTEFGDLNQLYSDEAIASDPMLMEVFAQDNS